MPAINNATNLHTVLNVTHVGWYCNMPKLFKTCLKFKSMKYYLQLPQLSKICRMAYLLPQTSYNFQIPMVLDVITGQDHPRFVFKMNRPKITASLFLLCTPNQHIRSAILTAYHACSNTCILLLSVGWNYLSTLSSLSRHTRNVFLTMYIYIYMFVYWSSAIYNAMNSCLPINAFEFEFAFEW